MPDSLEPLDRCLSDEDVLAFALGRLSAERVADAHYHLDRCEICQRLLSEAARALGTAATIQAEVDEPHWNTTFQPGMLIGQRYRIVRFIARGGMGEVYEALDEELLQRVALKTVMATASDDSKAVKFLKAEVQLARRVSHPNVCRIYDFGTHVMPQTSVPISFLTMELVEGETLGQCVRLGGALPLSDALSFARQLLQGLSAAHAAGVLHRDFKSDNVMLRAEADRRVTPLIMDFGLARTLDHQSQSASHNSVVGTFNYIAPEQLEGEPNSTASDLYSFGVVWFEMLTGELPFESGSAPAVAAIQRLHKAPPAPSSINPLLPRSLDAVVLRCMRRSRKARFQTASEVLAALDAADVSFGRARRRTLMLLAGTLALCAVGALGRSRLPARAELERAVPAAGLRADLAAALAANPEPSRSNSPPENTASTRSSATSVPPAPLTVTPIAATQGPPAKTSGPPQRKAVGDALPPGLRNSDNDSKPTSDSKSGRATQDEETALDAGFEDPFPDGGKGARSATP